ncbi:hypothetical protein CD33_12890 [Ureibacillus sinduriensis BLB-1 = JCM 15800]|uniref:Uncharacterized protein n=1 Tax=Ureibacillus sinduriensis BLB-1 = JCM 15800 TaxID=1384057 RepID=A0A0A3HXR7_9BACL|nr:hypothetical protein CD33_12890 [Ureibacillus sinduriensis BLB-1 = JCM 15800]
MMIQIFRGHPVNGVPTFFCFPSGSPSSTRFVNTMNKTFKMFLKHNILQSLTTSFFYLNIDLWGNKKVSKIDVLGG